MIFLIYTNYFLNSPECTQQNICVKVDICIINGCNFQLLVFILVFDTKFDEKLKTLVFE